MSYLKSLTAGSSKLLSQYGDFLPGLKSYVFFLPAPFYLTESEALTWIHSFSFSKSHSNLVLLPFNCIHKVIPSKRNEEKNPLQTKQRTFIELEGTLVAIKFFELNKPLLKKIVKQLQKNQLWLVLPFYPLSDSWGNSKKPAAPRGRVRK